MNSGVRSTTNTASTGWPRLVVLCAVVIVVWTVVLPRFAERPEIRAGIERQRALGLEPSAIFYSDHEYHWTAEAALSSAQRRRPAAWWGGE